MAEKKTSEKKATEKKASEKKKATETKAKAKEAEALHPTLQKKKERREAKAARKAANAVEEKKSRPNNLLLGLLIFGVLVAMFAVSGGYNYFQKPADIEKYIEDTGGEEVYGNVMVDGYTVAKVTAKGNSVDVEMTAEVEDEEIAKLLKEQYSGDEGKKNIEQIGASLLTNMKPNTRAFSADANIKMTLNKEELNSSKITYSQAKKILKDLEKEAEEAAESEDLVVDDEAVEVETDEDGHVHVEGEEHEEAEAEAEAEAETEGN